MFDLEINIGWTVLSRLQHLQQRNSRKHPLAALQSSECAHTVQVWGAKDVFYDNLNACKQVGNVILGFHEPDLSSGASMSVQVSSPASHDMVA